MHTDATRTPVPAAPGYADKEVTKPPNWHALVTWDVFFNALTTGVFLVAAVGELARPAAFAPVVVWAYTLALLLLVADLSCLVLDLGDPLRFHHMLRVFKPSSPMSLGTWCLTAYSVPLTLLVAVDVLTLLGVLPADSDAVWWVRRVLIVVGLPVAFGSAAYKGVLFSTTAQPGWRDARWLGAYHTGSAVVLGGAVLLVLALLVGAGQAAAVLRPALVALLAINAVPLVFLGREVWPALRAKYGDGVNRTVVLPIAGVLIPLVALLIPGGGAWVVVATAGFVLAGSWFARHVLVMLPHPDHF